MKLLDWYTLHHIWFFAVIASWQRFAGWPIKTAVAITMGYGIGWELLEQFALEPDFVWEPWYNRWVTDMLADLIGAYLGAKIADKLVRKSFEAD